MFNKIVVDYYGTQTPVNQLASFHVADAHMLTLTPYDKGSLGAIEKAIRDSDLGVNPTNDGNIIRVVFPQLTADQDLTCTRVDRARSGVSSRRRAAQQAGTRRR